MTACCGRHGVALKRDASGSSTCCRHDKHIKAGTRIVGVNGSLEPAPQISSALDERKLERALWHASSAAESSAQETARRSRRSSQGRDRTKMVSAGYCVGVADRIVSMELSRLVHSLRRNTAWRIGKLQVQSGDVAANQQTRSSLSRILACCRPINCQVAQQNPEGISAANFEANVLSKNNCHRWIFIKIIL